jgi:membrane associated rhomboid family serine protease
MGASNKVFGPNGFWRFYHPLTHKEVGLAFLLPSMAIFAANGLAAAFLGVSMDTGMAGGLSGLTGAIIVTILKGRKKQKEQPIVSEDGTDTAADT